MNTILIFVWVLAAFVAGSFWESAIEGGYPWASRQIGWRVKLTKKFVLTKYHFWVFVSGFFFLSLPLVIYGFNSRLVGILISAACAGIILEDFLYYLVNPFFSIKHFHPKEAWWYPWIKIGRINMPVLYVISIITSFFSWYFLWR